MGSGFIARREERHVYVKKNVQMRNSRFYLLTCYMLNVEKVLIVYGIFFIIILQ